MNLSGLAELVRIAAAAKGPGLRLASVQLNGRWIAFVACERHFRLELARVINGHRAVPVAVWGALRTHPDQRRLRRMLRQARSQARGAKWPTCPGCARRKS